MLPARNKLEISGIGDCFGFTDATRIRIIQLMIKIGSSLFWCSVPALPQLLPNCHFHFRFLRGRVYRSAYQSAQRARVSCISNPTPLMARLPEVLPHSRCFCHLHCRRLYRVVW
jgi:hypothetical protein